MRVQRVHRSGKSSVVVIPHDYLAELHWLPGESVVVSLVTGGVEILSIAAHQDRLLQRARQESARRARDGRAR